MPPETSTTLRGRWGRVCAARGGRFEARGDLVGAVWVWRVLRSWWTMPRPKAAATSGSAGGPWAGASLTVCAAAVGAGSPAGVKAWGGAGARRGR